MAGGPASVLILILLTMCLVPELDPLRGERNMIIDFYWTTGERRQIDQLDASRKNDLQQHDVRRIGKLQIEVMKLGDVGAVDPEIVLLANPRAKIVALHRFGANLE